MSPKIIALIDDKGQLQADFIAFPGRSCEKAEARLRRELAAFGVLAEGGAVRPKPEALVAQECQPDQVRAPQCRKLKI